jgi:hypothetical protein
MNDEQVEILEGYNRYPWKTSSLELLDFGDKNSHLHTQFLLDNGYISIEADDKWSHCFVLLITLKGLWALFLDRKMMARKRKNIIIPLILQRW